MDILSSLILGIVQGLTEFLPVSSTGHLIIARDLLGLSTDTGLFVDATFHFATALAVLVYFRKDIGRMAITFVRVLARRVVPDEDRTLMWALIIGTLPAVALGLLFNDYIETTWRSSGVVAVALLAGSLLMAYADRMSKRALLQGAAEERISRKNGFLVGCAQALALIPGISRSGATISVGLMLGFSREYAARFAFLLSFPIILGAGGVSALKLETSGVLSQVGMSIIVGAGAAFVTGMLAIHYFLKYLKRHDFTTFIVYRVILALLIIGTLVFF